MPTGRTEPTVNAAMRNGTALEPLARHAYVIETGHFMQPLVLQDGPYANTAWGNFIGLSTESGTAVLQTGPE